MQDLWAILLDSSGSMGSPFAGGHEFPGHVETGRYGVKLDAAKDRLLKELYGLGDSDVAVISFNDDPSLVYLGPATAKEEIRLAIEPISAAGNTNIAAALRFALNHVIRRGMHTYTSVLLISDGLSTAGDPYSAADEYRIAGVPVSTIVIDPTPEGELLARRISHGGRVSAVASGQALGQAIQQAGIDYAAARAPAEEKHSVATLVSSIAAFVAVSVAVAGVFTGVVQEPTIAVPITLAAVTFIASCALFYFAFAREKMPTAIYKNPSEMHFPRVYRFAKRTRWLVAAAAAFCLAVSVGLLCVAYIRGQ